MLIEQRIARNNKRVEQLQAEIDRLNEQSKDLEKTLPKADKGSTGKGK